LPFFLNTVTFDFLGTDEETLREHEMENQERTIKRNGQKHRTDVLVKNNQGPLEDGQENASGLTKDEMEARRTTEMSVPGTGEFPLSEDVISKHFSKQGDIVDEVRVDPQERTALVIFRDPKGLCVIQSKKRILTMINDVHWIEVG
jgi:hypothetical protein